MENEMFHIDRGYTIFTDVLAPYMTTCFWLYHITIRLYFLRWFSTPSRELLITYVHALLTDWSRVTHICVCKLIIIASDNGLSPGRRQAII